MYRIFPNILKHTKTNFKNVKKKKHFFDKFAIKKNLETAILGFLAEIYVGHLNEQISYYSYILC